MPNGYVQRVPRRRSRASSRRKAAVKKDPTGGAPTSAASPTPDDTTLVFKLDQPTSLGVIERAVAAGISAPVPEEYAKQYDAENPSTYGEHQLATGPYYDRRKLRSPNKEINLVRNPNWDAVRRGLPAGVPGHDHVQEGFADTVSAGEEDPHRQRQVNGDFTLRRALIKQAATPSDPDQLTLTPSGGNRYVALNTPKPPFDDINVRKAVVAGTDRDGAAQHPRRRAGRAGRDPLPPAGHPRLRGGRRTRGPGPDLDFLAEPERRPEVSAESYMKKAGFSSGKCEGTDCDDHHGRRQLAARVSDTAAGGQGPAREAGLQGQLPEGDARHHVHEVLQRSDERAERLPERRLAEGLQRRAVDARPDVQRRATIVPGEQLQLAAAQRSKRSTRRSTRRR